MRYIADIFLRSPAGTLVTLHVAERASYQTLPTDDPAKVWYPPRARRLANFEMSLFGAGRTSGATTAGVAEVLLVNGDRYFDAYETYSWEAVRILRGPSGRFVPFADFEVVYVGQVRRREYQGGNVSVALAEPQAGFAKAVPRHVYLGDNDGPTGLEGDASLAEQEAPLALGDVFNTGVKWVNKSLQIVQAAAQECAALTVKEKGLAVTSAGDVGDSITDPGLSIPDGQIVTDLIHGLARFGYTPEEPITADLIVGDTAAADLLLGINELMGDGGALVDTAAMDAFRAAAPAAMGWVIQDGGTGQEVADKVAESAGGYWLVDLQERLSAAVMPIPEEMTGPVALTITTGDRDVRLDREQADDEWGDLPIWRVEVYFGRNWTVMSEDQIFGAVSAAEKARLMREWPEPAFAEDTSILTAYPKAGVLKVYSALKLSAAAADLAERLLAMHGPWRRRLVADVPARLAVGLSLGARAYSKRKELGLQGGLDQVITGLSTENGRRFAVRLFG